MKITAVKTYDLEHKLPRRVGPSVGYFESRTALIVKLETDAGISGWGETDTFGGVRSLIDEQYAPVLIGRDPREHRKLWRELWGANFGNGIAMGGVDMALDDLRGKALGLSVADLYGGRLRDRVPVYASAIGYVEGVDPAEQMPREAAEMVGRGIRAIKLRIGGYPFKRDLAAVTAVRNVVGPDVKLMADGNGAYTLGSAVQMGRELERLGFYWFEEPLPQSTPDYAGYEALRDKLDIPIAACEALTSRGMFKEAIARRAMDIVQPDVVLMGGIGECLFVAELARLWGMQTMPHCWSSALGQVATAHLVSLLPDATWSRATETALLEMDFSENPLRDNFLVTPLHYSDGFVTLPKGPGLGVEVDEPKLKYYSKK